MRGAVEDYSWNRELVQVAVESNCPDFRFTPEGKMQPSKDRNHLPKENPMKATLPNPASVWSGPVRGERNKLGHLLQL